MITTRVTFTLLTKVLDARHTLILRDWLDFLTVFPDELVVYMPNRDDIYQSVDELCKNFQITWKAVYAFQEDDLSNNETAVLSRMVQQVNSEYLLFVNLDTLPYRNRLKDNTWLQEVFTKLDRNNQLVFFSGCGLIFRDDKSDGSGKYLQTQRFSNNFGLVRKDFWVNAMQKRRIDQLHDPNSHRYHSEWALEEELRQEKLFGIRRIETPDWRVFHVQQWDDRLFKTRDLFRQGVDIKKYLNRVHEDCLGRWDYYYNYPKPPLTRRIRVWVGKYRRVIWDGMRALTWQSIQQQKLQQQKSVKV